MAGGWRGLNTEELHNLYRSQNIIRVIKSRVMRWAGHVARMEAMRNAYNKWSKNLKGRDHSEDLGIDYNIRIDLREIEWEGVDCMHLAQDRDQWVAVVNTVMNLRAP